MSTSQRLAYAAPQIALSFSGVMLVPWLTYFYVPPAQPGQPAPEPLIASALFAAIMFGGRLVDGLADPAIGYFSDRVQSALGRRLPFLLYGTPILAISFGALWFPPFAPGHIGNAIFVATGLAIFWVMFTAVVAPYVALLPEITSTTSARVKLSSYRGVATLIGMILAAALVGPIQSAFPDGVGGFDSGLQFIAVGSAAAFLLFFLPVFSLREPPASSRKEVPAGLWRGLASTFSNPAFRNLISMTTLAQMGMIMVLTSLPYMSAQILVRAPGEEGWVQAGQAETWSGILMGVLVLGTVAWVPVINRLVPTYGKKRLMLMAGFSLAGVALALSAVSLFPEPALPMIVLMLAMTFPSAAVLILVSPLYADVVDFEEKRTGYRREGLFTGAMAVMGKTCVGMGNGLVVLLVGWTWQASDNTGGADVPIGLILSGPTAAVLLFVGTWLFRKFPLGD